MTGLGQPVLSKASVSFLIIVIVFTLFLFPRLSLAAGSGKPCNLLSAREVSDIVGTAFYPGKNGPSLPGSGQIICAWIAKEPLREKFDLNDSRENKTQVVVGFYPQKSAEEAREVFLDFFQMPAYTTDFKHKIQPQPLEGTGMIAFVSSGLFILHESVVFSIRFQPFLGAPRIDEFLYVEVPLAQLIASRL